MKCPFELFSSWLVKFNIELELTGSERIDLVAVLVVEAIALFESCELIGDDTRKDGTQHRSWQVAFHQSTHEQVNVVHRVVHQRQSINNRFVHDRKKLLERCGWIQSADLAVRVVSRQSVIATAPQIQRHQIKSKVSFRTKTNQFN